MDNPLDQEETPNRVARFAFDSDSTDWFTAPLHYRWQRHRPFTKANDGGFVIWRCSCGAFGPPPWIHMPNGGPEPNPRYRKLRLRWWRD